MKCPSETTPATGKPKEIAPPRTLKGRRARKLWRSIAPICAASGALTPASAPMLSLLCLALSRIEEDPDGASVFDVKDARMLSKSLRLTR